MASDSLPILLLFIPEEKYPSNESFLEGGLACDNSYFNTTFLMRSRYASEIKSGLKKRMWDKSNVISFSLETSSRFVDWLFRYFFDFRYMMAIRQIIKTETPDVVIVRDLPFVLLMCLLFRVRYKFKLGYQKTHPFEIRNQQPQHYRKQKLYPLWRIVRHIESIVLHKALRYADYVFPISQEMKRTLQIQHRIDARKLHVLTMGVSERLYSMGSSHNVQRLPRNQINVLYVGTFNDRNIERLLHSLSLIQQESSVNIVLTLAGGQPTQCQSLSVLANQMGLSSRITIPGYLDREELITYYLNTHIGISWVPNKERYNDAFPTKMIEYISFGIPFVATRNVVEHLRFIEHYRCGLLIDDSAHDLARGIMQLLGDYDCFAEHAQLTRTSIIENFRYRHIVRDLRLFIEQQKKNSTQDI